MLPVDESGTDYLVLRIGDEQYAVAGANVREVARWRPPTPVPGAPAVLPGIVSQRGLVLPVVDMRQLLGLPASTAERVARFVIVHYEAVEFALVVDAALDLVRLPTAELAQLPVGLDPQRARLLAAVAHYENQPLLLLDLAAIVVALRG